MRDTYNRIKICPFNNNDPKYCDLELEPDVKRLMAHSRNPKELVHVWQEWHDRAGMPLKNKFMRYVQLANQAARMDGKRQFNTIKIVGREDGIMLKTEYNIRKVQFDQDS